MEGLPKWVNNILFCDCVERYRVYLRRRGRPPKDAIALPVPLLCAIDAGQTTGVALLTPNWAVVLEARDDDFRFAKTLLPHLPKQATVCIESGFCPSAEAVYRAGVYMGLAYAKDFTPILIHPNAKAKVFKQSPLASKKALLGHAFQAFNLTLHRTTGEGGYFQHATDAVGLAFTYLRHNHNIPTPNIQLSLI